MGEKLKELKEKHSRLTEIYANEYGGNSNGVKFGSEGPVDVLLDKLREIENTFRNLGLNVYKYK